MVMHEDGKFDLKWKKQLLMFHLLALIHAKAKKFEEGLRFI